MIGKSLSEIFYYEVLCCTNFKIITFLRCYKHSELAIVNLHRNVLNYIVYLFDNQRVVKEDLLRCCRAVAVSLKSPCSDAEEAVQEPHPEPHVLVDKLTSKQVDKVLS